MALMYNKTNWKDDDESTPINARNLNNLEDGIEYIYEKWDDIISDSTTGDHAAELIDARNAPGQNNKTLGQRLNNFDSQIKENKKNIDFINLSNFGDDFLNFKKAIDYCKTNNKNLNIDIDVDLKNTETILIDFDLRINCNYKMFKMDNDLFLCSGSLFIDKIIVDEKENGFYKLCYLKSGGQLVCSNSKFLNFKHLGTPKECIIFDVENGSKSYFNNIEINNIKTKGNGTVTDGIGSQRFIRTKTNATDSDEIGTTVIKNIFINDFYNIDNNGNPVTEDSDPIVFQHGVKMFHNSIVENVKGKNIGKRVIKVQSPNVSISNVYLNNKNFNGEVTAISIQRNVTNVVVDGLEIQGNFIESKAVETFDCENITISNVILNVRSLKTQSGCAFIIGGKNIKLNNIKGNVGGFLTFINEETQNITVENVDLNVEYYSIYYGDFKNGLKANIKFNNVNLNYRDNSFPFQCVIFRNGTNIINDVYFNNSNFNLLNSYNYGVLSLIYCNNFHFRNCNLNTKSIGYGVYLNNSTNIVINNTFIDKLTNNIANCYLLNSKIDYIESISNNNKIVISSLLSEPIIKHSASSTPGVLVKPYNIS